MVLKVVLTKHERNQWLSHLLKFFETRGWRDGSVMHWLRALIAPAEDVGLIPSTHMVVAINCLQLQP